MLDFKQILIDLVKPIVEQPDEVTVIQTENGNTITLVLNVAPSDMGKVIGRNGRIAKAIRTIMKAGANSVGKKVIVEIR